MNKPKKILILTYWSFQDALIQTYTLPYVRLIREQLGEDAIIYLVTLEKDGQATEKELPGDPGIRHLALNYIPFGGKAALKWIGQIRQLSKIVRKEKIEVIHAWCTPAGAIAHILSRLTKRPLVIDSYEPHAEAMVENGTWKRSGAAFRFLFGMEKRMSKHASHLIACVEGMQDYAEKKYGLRNKRVHVKPACVDLQLFKPVERKNETLLEELGLKGKTIGFYAGKFGGIYLDEDVFRFFRECMHVFGSDLHFLLLTNQDRKQIDDWCHQYAIDPHRIITRFVPHQEVSTYMQLADFAMTPVKPVPTKRYCTPIKDGEYWACGLPLVITSNISDDSMIIEKENAGVVLKGFTDTDLRQGAKKLKLLLESEDRSTLQNRIRKIAEVNRNFSIARSVYREIYG